MTSVEGVQIAHMKGVTGSYARKAHDDDLFIHYYGNIFVLAADHNVTATDTSLDQSKWL